MQTGHLLLQAVLVWMLLAGQCGFVARAAMAGPARIEVFISTELVLTGHPDRKARPGADGPAIEVYLLDGVQRIEAMFSAGLSAGPRRSAERVLERVRRLDEADRARLEHAATGLVRAMHYNITRYPAIVFDARAVVYGLTDLDAAWRHYRAWRSGAAP